MSQPRNNLAAFDRQLSGGRGTGGASSGASVDTRPAAGKSKFKPANTGGHDAGTSQGTGAFKPARTAAAGVRKVGSLQTFSSPGFGKPKPAPPPTSHSQPASALEPQQARIPAINTPRAPPSASRFKPASAVRSTSSPAPRISAGGTIDVSPSGSESAMPVHAASATSRKRPSGEVPLVPPAAGIKRLKTSPTPSERGSPVGESEKENRALFYSAGDKGKGKEKLPSSSLGSSQTLIEVGNGLENEDLRSKTVQELQHLSMYNMETVAQLKKDRKAFDFEIKTEQDVYLLDVFIRLAEARGQAIEEALAQRKRGPSVPDSQAHTETQLLDEDYDIPPSPPPPPPPSLQANFSHSSDDHGSTFNPDDETDFEPPPRQQSYEAPLPRQQSYEYQPLRQQLPPMHELFPEPEPEPEPAPGDPTPEPEPEPEQPEVTEIMSDDEAEFWNYGPTTQDIDDTDDIEILDAPLISAAGSVGTIAAATTSHNNTTAVQHTGANFDPSAFNGDPTKSPYYDEVMRVLRSRFKLSEFRPNQLETIIATLEGRDVFTLMPTGGGKSLCFQLPAVVSPGVTVVISPLIALMMDQLRELEQRKIKTVYYNSSRSAAERSEATQALLHPIPDMKPNMVYMTPEKLVGNDQMSTVLTTLYNAGLLARFVIDEAHLVHTWGRNFRESFLNLKVIRKRWPNVPIVALTATATPTAQVDIMGILGMRPDTLRLSQSFNRPNLRYKVIQKPRNLVKEIATFINNNHRDKTGIIYCIGKQKCERVAEQLRKEGISAHYFHADLIQSDKDHVFNSWMDGRTKVVVCTIAFGMGINKPDVRFVIHHDVAYSMANYLQETGRAGRDGLDSDCVMYYSYTDSQFLMKRHREDENLSASERDRMIQEVRDIVEFALNTVDCRRAQLLARFDESFDPEQCNKTCDNCQNDVGGEIVMADCSAAASGMVRLVREAVERNIQKIPRGSLIAAFRGKTPKEVIERGMNYLASFGCGKDVDMGLAERIFDRLMTICVFLNRVEILKYPANYVELSEPRVYEPWIAGRQTLEIKVRMSAGKKKAGGRTNSKKKAPAASSRAELASDPIEDDDEAPSRALWQDDEEADASYAPEPDTPVAGPSRPRRAKPASRRAPPEPESDEVIEIPTTPGAGEDWHSLCYKKLQEVRQQLTEDLVVPDDVLPDQCLEMLSLVLPADGAQFTRILADELGDENEANVRFRKYGRRLLDVCVKFSIRSSGRSASSTPAPGANASASGSTDAPPPKRKFKPAMSASSLPSASQLHRAYDYQGTPKPASSRGR
ncbi:unnamed protein product [Peniophora sp. CBMAI 1063]|nr:unnamed protein product [Peniophora sp. CBMAI 1063]